MSTMSSTDSVHVHDLLEASKSVTCHAMSVVERNFVRLISPMVVMHFCKVVASICLVATSVACSVPLTLVSSRR